MFSFNRCVGPCVIVNDPIADLVRRAALLDASTSDHHQRFRYVLGGGKTLFEIGLQIVDDTPRLDSMTLHIFADDDARQADRPIASMRYYVTQWADYDGLHLPRTACCDAYAFDPPDGSADAPLLCRAVLQRQSARRLDAPPPQPAFFNLSADQGSRVVDYRLHLVYRAGDTALSIDGFDFQTQQPLDLDTAESLPDLAITPAPRRAPSADFSPDEEHPPSDRDLGRQEQSPLRGVAAHDFSVVQFTRRPVELHHTFHLTNPTGHPVTITKSASSCGCTVTRPLSAVVAPRDAVDTEVALRLAEPGARAERVWLVLSEEHGAHELNVSAVAMATERFFLAQRAVVLTPGQPCQITAVWTTRRPGAPPPPLELEAPANVNAHFDGWRFLHGADPELGRMAHWQATVSLRLLTGKLAPRSTLAVRLPSGQAHSVDLTGWPRG